MENYCQDVKKKNNTWIHYKLFKTLGGDVIKYWWVSIQAAANKSEGWRDGRIWQFSVLFRFVWRRWKFICNLYSTHSILNINNNGNTSYISRVWTGWHLTTSVSARAAVRPGLNQLKVLQISTSCLRSYQPCSFTDAWSGLHIH